MAVRADHNAYRIGSVLGESGAFVTYRATCVEKGTERPVVIRASRAREGEEALATEVQVLRALMSTDAAMRELMAPYLPDLIEECDVVKDTGAPGSHSPASGNTDLFAAVLGPRRGRAGARPARVRSHNALAYGEHEMFSLREVRTAYPDGVEAQDSAWMFRRLLMALGLVHAAGCAHGSIDASHVLILPEEHGLVLWDWTRAGDWSESLAPEEGEGLDEGQEAYRQAARHDVACAARAALSVTKGADMPPRLRSFYRYLISAPPERLPQAFDLLDDYDALIEDLWGQRRFRPFAMPPAAKDGGSPQVEAGCLAAPNHNETRRP
jgi:hypothetical protein